MDVWTRIACAYAWVPVAVFVATWIRLPVALVGLFAIAAAAWLFEKGACGRPAGGGVRVGPAAVAFAVLAALFVGWLAGWLGDVPQSGDWPKHNAVLYDLVSRPWPVYYAEAGGHAMLTYYIGGYLVPALFGKLLGSYAAAYVAQYLWSCAGLLVVMSGFVLLVGPRRRWMVPAAVAMLLLFGCALPLARGLARAAGILAPDSGDVLDLHWFRTDALRLQFRSVFVALRWVHPQAIVPWVCTLLLMARKRDVGAYAFLVAPALLCGSLQFLSLFAAAVALWIVSVARSGRAAVAARAAASLCNLASAVPGAMVAVYLVGNVAGPKPDGYGLALQGVSPAGLASVAVFAVCWAPLALLSAPRRGEGDRDVFLVAVAGLAAIPFVRLGLNDDFCMGASMPPLLALAVFVARRLFGHSAAPPPGRARVAAICALLALGALYPLTEAVGTLGANAPSLNERNDPVPSLRAYADLYGAGDLDPDSTLWVYNYFTHDADSCPFVRWLARTRP